MDINQQLLKWNNITAWYVNPHEFCLLLFTKEYARKELRQFRFRSSLSFAWRIKPETDSICYNIVVCLNNVCVIAYQLEFYGLLNLFLQISVISLFQNATYHFKLLECFFQMICQVESCRSSVSINNNNEKNHKHKKQYHFSQCHN